MDERVARLKSPGECEQFIANVKDRLPELARLARRRAVELRAAAHEAKTDAEREAVQAVYAYEEGLFKQRGKRIRASRTWQMIEKHGIIGAVERVVNRRSESAGYKTLVEMGMQDMSFEAVVLRHPAAFSPEAAKRSAERLQEWNQA
ncbi:MAG: hypothetical protein QGH74_10475 [Candidatus Brocadiia bacterium]|jgi:hypothetical protein|nr:hypothetical protein [Candidatus Brocadiia bacterium]